MIINRLLSGFVIGLFVFSLFSFVSAQEDTDEPNHVQIRAWQMEIRHANIERTHLFLSTTAQGMIDYIESIGGDTNTLEKHKDTFDGFLDGALATGRHIDLNDILFDARSTMKDFNAEYKTQFSDNEGKPLMALVTIGQALEANKAEREALDDAYWKVREENSMNIYDLKMEQLRIYIDWFADNGYETDELEEQYKLLEDKQEELRTAMQERKPLEIAQIFVDIAEIRNELILIAESLLKG